MGLANSPLRDRVVFVEGVPRSGTTLLTTLLLAHPRIEGSATESHLFDYGVERLFDNFDDEGRNHAYLAAYVSRRQLVDSVRDLCDEILRAPVRDRVAGQFVLEKTPVPNSAPAIALRRKAECYPDAWYIHIVRAKGDSIRSLTRIGWYETPRAAGAAWEAGVTAVRSAFGALPHFREISYEELVRDPAGIVAELLDWLGLTVTQAEIERLSVLARERVSQIPDAPRAPRPQTRRQLVFEPRRGRLMASITERLRQALRKDLGVPAELASALQSSNSARARDLLDNEVSVTVRTSEGDMTAQGDAGVELLESTARIVWSLPFSWQQTALSDDQKATTIFFSGIRDGTHRVDIALVVRVERDLVSRVTMLSVGPLQGRKIAELKPFD